MTTPEWNERMKERAIGRAQALLELSPNNPMLLKTGFWLSQSRTWLDNNLWGVTLDEHGGIVTTINSGEI